MRLARETPARARHRRSRVRAALTHAAAAMMSTRALAPVPIAGMSMTSTSIGDAVDHLDDGERAGKAAVDAR